jgi:hypothetical protein
VVSSPSTVRRGVTPGRKRAIVGSGLASGVLHAMALTVLCAGGGSLAAPPPAERSTVDPLTVDISAITDAAPSLRAMAAVAPTARGPTSGRRAPRRAPASARRAAMVSDAAPATDRPPSSGEAAPTPTPASGRRMVATPTILSPAAARALRTYDVYPAPKEPLPTGVPQVLAADICVSDRGVVSDVSVAPSGLASLETALRAAIWTWRYRPLLLDGLPTPFCHPMRFIYQRD